MVESTLPIPTCNIHTLLYRHRPCTFGRWHVTCISNPHTIPLGTILAPPCNIHANIVSVPYYMVTVLSGCRSTPPYGRLTRDELRLTLIQPLYIPTYINRLYPPTSTQSQYCLSSRIHYTKQLYITLQCNVNPKRTIYEH